MIKIIADSTCDLTDEILEKYNVSLVPLKVVTEDKTYRDRIDISATEFYELLKTLKKQPTTSTPSPKDYIDCFKEAASEGYNKILCICMSSGTSGSYQSAVIAHKQLRLDGDLDDVEIYILDSASMSQGSGLLVMKSAQMFENGASYEEIIKFNEDYKTKVKHLLCVNDMKNLLRSGRLTNGEAFLGRLLRIKPIMTLKNKKGIIYGQERGWNKVYKRYIDEFIKRWDKTMNDFIILGYSDDLSLAENFKKQFLKKTDFQGIIYIMQKGPSVGNHVGSGGLSMFFIEK